VSSGYDTWATSKTERTGFRWDKFLTVNWPLFVIATEGYAESCDLSPPLVRHQGFSPVVIYLVPLGQADKPLFDASNSRCHYGSHVRK
jgi:hypothetical protein